VTTQRKLGRSIIAAILIIVALGRTFAQADNDDDEKAITSSAAQISRDSAGHVFIAIRPAAQKAIGIATETLQATVRPVEVEAYGFILNPAPLAKLNGDLLGAQASLDAARAQYQRSKRLYAEQGNASLRDLQTTQASYLADKSRFEALGQQLRNDWGNEIASLNPAERRRLVHALVTRSEALARVTAPIGERLEYVPHAARIVVLGHEDQPLDARSLYAAPTVVQTLQGQAFIALLAASRFPLTPGSAVSARIPIAGTSQTGVTVPRSAVVQYAGKEWVYCQLDGNRFLRREIRPAETIGQGYFVTGNLAPGSRIVVEGAQTLLSEELKMRIQVED
jgi:multidrug efflux system membrane fusion protein